MDLFDVAKACARRWYVFIPLLAIAAWFSYSAYIAAKPVYYGTAVVGFSSPSSRVDSVATGEPVSRNGLMDFGGASLVANMTSLALLQPSVIDQVASEGGSRRYVSKILDVQGSVQQLPLVKLEVTDPDSAKVARTLDLLVGQAATTLRTLQQQARVPDDRMVASVVVSPPSTPVAGMPTRTRSTIANLAVGAALAIVVAVLFDAIVRRLVTRIRGRSSGTPRAENGTSPTATDDEPNAEATAQSGERNDTGGKHTVTTRSGAGAVPRVGESLRAE